MGADAPQWLFSSFVDAMQDIGASAPIPVLEAEARDLISRWNAQGRFLHNTRHLLKTLSRIDEIASTAHDPDVVLTSSAAVKRAMSKSLRRCITRVRAWKLWE